MAGHVGAKRPSFPCPLPPVEQHLGGLLVLVIDHVVYHMFLTFFVIPMEIVDVKSTYGYLKVCTSPKK